MRKAKEMGALTVSRLKEAGLHFVAGVPGLALQVLPTGARTWVLRAAIGDRRRGMGLGGFPDIPLARAREAGWKNVEHRQPWTNSFTTHAFPKMLAAPGKISKVRHHAALLLSEMGPFMKELRALPGIGARALDGGARAHEGGQGISRCAVYRSGQAARRTSSQRGYVFPSATGKQLSDVTRVTIMRRIGMDAVPHGFRSTFRDWAAEHTHDPRDVAEMALAHTIADKVEATDRRGDLFEICLVKSLKRTLFLGSLAGRSSSSAESPARSRNGRNRSSLCI